MGNIKKKFSKEFKARVAIEAIKGLKTASEISSEYSCHPTQIAKWKRELKAGLPGLFGTNNNSQEKDNQKLVDDLYKRIGQLEMENDWLKKKLPF